MGGIKILHPLSLVPEVWRVAWGSQVIQRRCSFAKHNVMPFLHKSNHSH